MASTWTLAPALSALIREVNARWPHRSKASDGTIGDTAHAARKSEHNPDAKGVVRAVDITVAGIDKAALLKAVIGDSRVHYVISDRKIYSRSNSWAPRAYTGANPHDKHVHISLRNRTSESADWATVNKAAADTSSWGIASSSSSSSGPSSSSSSTTSNKPTTSKPSMSTKPKLVGTVSVSDLKAARYADPPKTGTPLGKHADQVFTMETALVKTGWIKPGLADGHFGTATVGDGSSGFGGTTGFQRKHSGAVKPDGWLGKKELRLLFRLAGMSVQVVD